MKALVTGGAGFIGSNVIALLLDRGYSVRVLDNLSSGYIENLKHFIYKNEIQFCGGDIRDFRSVDAAMKDVDAVFHLAACVGRQRSLDNPVLDSQINVIGTLNVLEAMRKHGVSRIVYSSSAAIFGELFMPTISESHPQNADSPYGVSKLAAEKMILSYSGLYGIKAVCLRYFNIYGINQRYDLYGNVIPIFAKRIYAKEPIIIYGDGTQTRDFVDVSDVARANYIADAKCRETEVFNLGSGSTITIHDLAEKMQKIAGIKVGVQYEPERPADVKHCKADASKIQKMLGFKTETKLDDGLEYYLRWYRDNCAGE